MHDKRLKDPIYGYIDISTELIEKVVDTAEFQRLRSIIQTSYSPLYASAVHNRFVHSLGVYHLGTLVSTTFEDYIEKNNLGSHLKKMVTVFQYACLLHDVGHAPFSHTGEQFYLERPESSRDPLHNEIADLISDEDFLGEIKKENYEAAPHELMSVVVALKKFPDLFENAEEKSFFARCILGYKYVQKEDGLLSCEKSFLNCMISMLNSSIIDVDKLDYLIRDAYITGFDTVAIDFRRLLTNVIIFEENNLCKLVYTTGAISVIENVVFAHDAERKWIQNHPIVVYDSYLLQRSLENLDSEYHVFNEAALSVEGTIFTDGYRVSLLSDGDILFLMKNKLDDPFIVEYFARRNRRHPLWKSEAEYKALFSLGYGGAILTIFERNMEELLKAINYLGFQNVLNNEVLSAFTRDMELLEKTIQTYPDEKKALYREPLARKKQYVDWLNCFRSFAEDQGIEFDFVIIQVNQFNSGFIKIEFENIEVKFPTANQLFQFKEVTNALSAKKSDRKKFFYIYARRNKDNASIDVQALLGKLGKLAIDEAYSINTT